jgi:hypothetical protein
VAQTGMDGDLLRLGSVDGPGVRIAQPNSAR